MREITLYFVRKLIKRFTNIYKSCNKDISKFILLLRKGIYQYEYKDSWKHEHMDSWKRFDEKSLPNKEDFYSILNMEDITDVDHMHA